MGFRRAAICSGWQDTAVSRIHRWVIKVASNNQLASDDIDDQGISEEIRTLRDFRFLPVDPPTQLRTGRRILFIGDSFTAGLGILGNATCQYYDAVGTLENAYLTYASLAALQLDSDYQLIAWSGAGVEVQTQFDMLRTLMVPSAANNGALGSLATSMGSFGSPEGSNAAQGASEAARVFPTDPQLFQRAVAGDPASAYNFSLWAPQVVVFAGGVNDFAAELPDKTTWVTDIYNDTEVVLLALPFVGQLSGLPGALNAGQGAAGESSGAYQAYMARLYTELQLRGVPRAHFLALNADGLDASTWCQFHPNLKAHQVMGEQLVAFMRAALPDFVNGSFPTTVNNTSA
ncbi:g3704 [Coccomyxa elongata]